MVVSFIVIFGFLLCYKIFLEKCALIKLLFNKKWIFIVLYVYASHVLAEESLNLYSLYYLFVYAFKASYHFWKVSNVASNPLNCRAVSFTHRIVWHCAMKKNGVHKQANTSYTKELHCVSKTLLYAQFCK